jgi:hypothetical protein
MSDKLYLEIITGFLNREPHARRREARVREANRKLYRLAVNAAATDTEADLALAHAAATERRTSGQG